MLMLISALRTQFGCCGISFGLSAC